MNTAEERRKLIYDRHIGGESYSKIARTMGVSSGRVRQLDLAYKRRLTQAKKNHDNWRGANLATGVVLALARNNVKNIDQLQTEVSKGIERRWPLRWYVAGKYFRNIGDKTWLGELFPLLESIGFNWREHYIGDIQTIDSLLLKGK